VSSEFVPPKFLIEKSTINPASEIVSFDDITDATKAGRIEYEQEVPVAGSTQTATRRDFLRDSNGELVVKFTENIIIDQGDITSILGQLGTFRYLDSVEPDQTYYYRVRALVGDLKLTGDNQIDWGKLVPADNRRDLTVRWPSTSQGEEAVVMAGKPTGTVSVRIPEEIEDFDVVENLKRVFQAGFSLDFHRQNDPVELDPTGTQALFNLAGQVGGKDFSVLYGQLNGLEAGQIADLDVTEGPFTYPWEEATVRRQSARLADAVASALLEAGGSALTRFRDLMQSPNFQLGENTLEDATFRVTGGVGEDGEGTDDSLSSSDKAAIWLSAYNSDEYRTDLVEVINFIKAFTGGGVSPDWVSVNPLRDIVPWSGQILYDLLDKVQSLVDAFAGVADEINNFIDLLTRKIETLERTLEFLISILDLIESLQVGAFLLAAPDIEGDVVEWITELDEATNKPPEGPGGYSAGVALAYVAPDITAFKTAFSIIFGV
jgi:hypothetical protein